jgi:hypothetical protein
LLHLAVYELANLGANIMEIIYEPTERNRPTLKVLEEAKLEKVNAQTFRVDIDLGYEKPEFVELKLVD